MPTTVNEPATDTLPQTPPVPAAEHFRPLYVRRVPEEVWILVHDNAIRSRMRLQDYIVEILKDCQPIPR